MKKGKEKCEILKKIRTYVAKKYGLDYEPSECTHEGSCLGSCHKCDDELCDLQAQLDKKGIDTIASDKVLTKLVGEYSKVCLELDADMVPVGQMRDFGEPYQFDEDAILSPLMGEPYPIPQEEKREFMECRVAGTSYHHVDDMLDTIYVGRKVHLVRDRENKHGKNAVAVSFNNPNQQDSDDFDFSDNLGYIPRECNAALAGMLDIGWERAFDAYISEINPKSDYEKLRITIHIKSMKKTLGEEQKDYDGLFWVMNLSADELDDFEHRLYLDGFVYYRWRIVPIDELDSPEKEDRIVFFGQKEDGSYKVYLMMVLAEGDSCYPYLWNKPDFLMKDDCSPIVLSCIKGPVLVDEEVTDGIFKGKEKELIDQPVSLLSKKATERFKELLGIEDIEQ